MTPTSTPHPLTMYALRSLQFSHDLQQFHYSWSPAEAFANREAGAIDGPTGYETLHAYLSGTAAQRQAAASTLLEVPDYLLPKPDLLILVYRAVNGDTGAGCGAILPGACVTDSSAYAHLHGERAFGATDSWALLKTEVFPDELVTFGDPHEFLYVPRSLSVAHARYLQDLARRKELASTD